jgi:hypothetical protein
MAEKDEEKAMAKAFRAAFKSFDPTASGKL